MSAGTTLRVDAPRRVGRYEILQEIGRGGMATVYLARQAGLGREVALKELSSFHASDPLLAERFVRESRTAAALSHPNIVTVHDHFHENGTPYIAMEFLGRGSLRSYMGRIGTAQLAGVLEGTLAGLTQAESARIIHRDLKPENLLVTADGAIKIGDFGIAKVEQPPDGAPTVTEAGSTVGTPAYMAPEQALGRDLGPWTDLYSLGVIAYEALAGRLPFPEEEAPMATLLHHINDPLVPLRSLDPRIDPALAAWVEQLLAKETFSRPPSAADAWDELEGIVIDVLGPRWRRKARLLGSEEIGAVPKPLTPAPFTRSRARPKPARSAVAAETLTAAPRPFLGRLRRRRAAALTGIAALLVAAAGFVVAQPGPPDEGAGRPRVSAAASAGYAGALNAALGTLATARAEGYSGLGEAETARGQATAAERTASAYRRAARSVRAIESPAPGRQAHREIVRRLAGAKVTWQRLADAAGAGNSRRYAAAAAEIRAGERAARGSLTALEPLGYILRQSEARAG